MRNHHAGQSVVEFALVAPIFFTLLFGIIAAGWLFFQFSAVNDAAQGGARDAITYVVTGTGAGVNYQRMSLSSSNCATGLPVTVPAATQRAANIIPVNPGQLCKINAGGAFCPSGGGNELLVQTAVASDANIDLCAFGGIANPTAYSVQVTYIVHPLEPLLGSSIQLQSVSTLTAQQLPS